MLKLGATALRGSIYALGTITGLAIAIPLAAAAFTAHPARLSAPVVPISVSAGPVEQAHLVNRATKGSRLDVRAPAAPVENSAAENMTVIVKASPVIAPATRTATSAETKPASALPPTRAMPSLRGCLSSIGVTKSNLTTEELTVCMADASTVNRIN